ncbi:glutamate 5-kinase, partial [Escherichia coli]|nr:glutamate 5-kinase [Escherichia coli]
LAGDSVSGLGTGGMATKLQAADVARRAGVNVVIATGQMPEVIGRLAKGERIGTLFPALASPLEGRKSWILAGPPPHGEVHV